MMTSSLAECCAREVVGFRSNAIDGTALTRTSGPGGIAGGRRIVPGCERKGRDANVPSCRCSAYPCRRRSPMKFLPGRLPEASSRMPCADHWVRPGHRKSYREPVSCEMALFIYQVVKPNSGRTRVRCPCTLLSFQSVVCSIVCSQNN